jgi:outer membrane protein OmpA-like peptidoglycan-associated protein
MKIIVFLTLFFLESSGNLAFSKDLRALKDFSDEELIEWAQPNSTSRSSGTRSLGTRNTSIKPKTLEFKVLFDFNSHRIAQEDILQLERLANVMMRSVDNGSSFIIEGHTDRKGSFSYNMELSQKRARSVMTVLKNAGVEGSLMTAKGKGFTELLNRDDPFADENRRVRILAVTN